MIQLSRVFTQFPDAGSCSFFAIKETKVQSSCGSTCSILVMFRTTLDGAVASSHRRGCQDGHLPLATHLSLLATTRAANCPPLPNMFISLGDVSRPQQI